MPKRVYKSEKAFANAARYVHTMGIPHHRVRKIKLPNGRIEVVPYGHVVCAHCHRPYRRHKLSHITGCPYCGGFRYHA